MKQLVKISLLLLISLGIYNFSNAQRVKATAKLDSTQILIGDQIKMQFSVEHPDNIEVTFPTYTENLTNKIEVIKSLGVDTIDIEENTLIKEVQSYIITSFDSGSYRIPPQWIKINTNGNIDSIPTNGVDLRVLTMKIDTAKGLTDIHMPYKVPLSLKEVTPYILFVILALAILFFIFYYLRKRKKEEPIFFRPKRPKEPAYVIALRELNTIKNSNYLEKGKIKQYYSDITDTLRAYIEDRFNVSAMEQTTDETIDHLNKKNNILKEDEISQLEKWLRLSDLVKFAKYTPTQDNNIELLPYAFNFVERTKEVEQPKDDQIDNSGNAKIEKV